MQNDFNAPSYNLPWRNPARYPLESAAQNIWMTVRFSAKADALQANPAGFQPHDIHSSKADAYNKEKNRQRGQRISYGTPHHRPPNSETISCCISSLL
jgi:hypothetical protein